MHYRAFPIKRARDQPRSTLDFTQRGVKAFLLNFRTSFNTFIQKIFFFTKINVFLIIYQLSATTEVK